MRAVLGKHWHGWMGLTVALGIGWGLIIFFPVLPSHALQSSVQSFFARICHQVPHRSFAWGGKTLPVCVRCTGLYGGAFLGVLFHPWIMKAKKRPVPWKVLFGGVALFNLIEWWGEGIWRSPWPRALAGALLGGLLGLCLAEGWKDPCPSEEIETKETSLRRRLSHGSIA